MHGKTKITFRVDGIPLIRKFVYFFVNIYSLSFKSSLKFWVFEILVNPGLNEFLFLFISLFIF